MRRIIFLTATCLAFVSCGPDLQMTDTDDDVWSPGATQGAHETEPVRVTAEGWRIHGVHISRNDLAKWAPVVTFHPEEPYLPCSIDALLRHAVLVDAQDHVLSKHPSQADLQHATDRGDRLILGATQRAGAPLDAQHHVQAPMYVSAQVPADGSYVDINYIFLMAFNGSQTARVKAFGTTTEVLLPHFANHEGDIESISVRVTPDFRQAKFVRIEGHGHWQFFKPQDVQFSAGTHPMILSALNSHANYNAKAFADHHQHVEAQVSALGFGLDVVDITDNAGPTWAPFLVDAQGETHDTGHLTFVGLDNREQVVGDQAWAAFEGHIGDYRDNLFAGVQNTDGTRPAFSIRQFADTLVNGAVTLGHTRRFTRAEGPTGLANRGSIHLTQPLWDPPQDF